LRLENQKLKKYKRIVRDRASRKRKERERDRKR
jgi:hypothetical protein